MQMSDRRDGVPPPDASSDATSEALESVYEDLRQLARRYVRYDAEGQTLQPTALAHEAYLRLARRQDISSMESPHFVRLAARAMKSVIVDHARHSMAAKRGGGAKRVNLDLASITRDDARPHVDLLALDEALEQLTEHAPRLATVVELRFFGGLTIEETATVLRVSERTVRRDWQLACAWLKLEVQGKGGP